MRHDGVELAGGFVAFVVAFVGADFELMLRGVLSVRVSHFRGFFGVLEQRELFGEGWRPGVAWDLGHTEKGC